MRGSSVFLVFAVAMLVGCGESGSESNVGQPTESTTCATPNDAAALADVTVTVEYAAIPVRDGWSFYA